MTSITGNRGEWSEVYAFFKVLLDQEIRTKDDRKYPIIRVRRMDRVGNYTYRICGNDLFEISSDWDAPRKVSLPELRNSVNEIFEAISEANGHAFPLPSAESLMNALECHSIKSPATNKNDLVLTTVEGADCREINLGFSIKSSLGSAPTLLNASDHTNFLYRVKWLDADLLSELSKEGLKVQVLVRKIYELGGTLEFMQPKSPIFSQNLITSDFSLPLIMSEILIAYYRGLARRVSQIVQITFQISEKLQSLGMEIGQIEYKMKIFLENVALGMVPAKKWDWTDEADWGYLLVGEDGELLCLHKYWRNLFRDYLFESTALDTPSTWRHGYGRLYTNMDWEYCIDLNVQIRFLK